MNDYEEVLPDHFLYAARHIFRRVPTNSAANMQRFRSFFGVSPHVCARLWLLMDGMHTENGKHEHLL